MTFADITTSEVFALTRMRRAESRARRREALIAKWGPTRRYPAAPYPAVDVFTLELLRQAIRAPELAKRVRLKESSAERLSHRRIADARLRASLYEAQDGICHLCQQPMVSPGSTTLDHVWPRGLGGKQASNLLLTHGPCNNEKADRKPTAAEMAYLRLINTKRQDPAKQDSLAA